MPNDLRALLKNSVSYEPGRLEESNYPFVFEFNYEEMLQTLECAERLGYDRGYNEGWNQGFSMGHGLEMAVAGVLALAIRSFGRKRREPNIE